MAKDIQGLIFDLNGTMIDDMRFHVKAWYGILNDDLKASLSWEEVKVQMYGKNSEVLERIFGKEKFTPEEAATLSIEKEKRYQQAYKPKLTLIAGLSDLLKEAQKQHLPMAIGSAAIPFNIDFVLNNLHIRKYFKAIVSAADVIISKPHPETFLTAAKLIEVNPINCVVFEDAPKGVEAAQNAGMKCIVLTTMHPKTEFSRYDNILHYIKDYTDPYIRQFLAH